MAPAAEADDMLLPLDDGEAMTFSLSQTRLIAKLAK
jgi:hypothetical protein